MSDALLYGLQLAIFALASWLHGLAGMGFPMIGTIALAILLPLPKAVAIMAFPSLIISLIILFSNNNKGVWEEAFYYLKTYWLLAFTALLGSIIGVKLLMLVPAGVIYLMMAAITIYYVVNGYLSDKEIIKPIKIPTGTVSLIVFGLVAGIVGGATNVMSPILMMFLFAKADDKHEIVKAGSICYLLGKIVQIVMLREEIYSLISNEVYVLIALTFVSICFLMMGIRLRNRISDLKFRNTIYVILLLLSMKVGYSGVQYLVV